MKPRAEKSLKLATQRFVRLFSPTNDVVDLLDAAVVTGVPMRRIYDICSALSGIGVLETCKKSRTARWKYEYKGRAAVLHAECEQLRKMEAKLNRDLVLLKKELNRFIEEKTTSRYAYISLSTLRSVSEYSDQSIITIERDFKDDVTATTVAVPGIATVQLSLRTVRNTTMLAYFSPSGSATRCVVTEVGCVYNLTAGNNRDYATDTDGHRSAAPPGETKNSNAAISVPSLQPVLNVVTDEATPTNEVEVYEIPQLSVASNTVSVTENVIYHKTYGLGLVEVPQLSDSLQRLPLVEDAPVNENSSGTAAKEVPQLPCSIQRPRVDGDVPVNENSSGIAAKEKSINCGSSASKGEEKKRKIVKQKRREVRKRKSRDEPVVDGATKKLVKELVNPAQISLFSVCADESENVVMNSETTVTTKKAVEVVSESSEPSDGISSKSQAPLSERHPSNGRSQPSVMAVASAESSSTLRNAEII